jgi:hypothetical protein
MHFSGCKGRIDVRDCEMAGASDDMMNVHGTYLRVVARPGPTQVLVRFMHPQSYGFEAFVPGDDIEFVSRSSLCAYASNRVTAAEAKDGREILLTLQDPAPAKIGDGDVVENVTWTPSVEVSHCRVTLDSCRGFLLTTRQPVLIESNTFVKTAMPAILVSGDANLWFESGCVRDMTIRGNRFLHCGEPVIEIEPKTRGKGPADPVHHNIRILGNYFALDGHKAISARRTGNLLIEDNRFSTSELPVQTMDCTGVTIAGNKLGAGQAQLRTAPLPGQSGF